MNDPKFRFPDHLDSNARLKVEVEDVVVGARRIVDFKSSDSSVSISGTDDKGAEDKITLDFITSGGNFSTDRLSATVDGTISDGSPGDDVDWSGRFVYQNIGSSFDFSGLSINNAVTSPTILADGIYAILASITYDSDPGTGSYRGMSLECGFVSLIPSWVPKVRVVPVGGDSTFLTLSLTYYFSAGDVITVSGIQDSGGPFTINAYIDVQRIA